MRFLIWQLRKTSEPNCNAEDEIFYTQFQVSQIPEPILIDAETIIVEMKSDISNAARLDPAIEKDEITSNDPQIRIQNGTTCYVYRSYLGRNQIGNNTRFASQFYKRIKTAEGNYAEIEVYTLSDKQLIKYPSWPFMIANRIGSKWIVQSGFWPHPSIRGLRWTPNPDSAAEPNQTDPIMDARHTHPIDTDPGDFDE